MAIYLNLSLLKPLDLLLTSGDGMFSKVIRVASAAKTMATADFSHAALLLAPSVIIESLTEEGIVCNNLLNPIANPHSASRSSESVDNDSPFQPIWVNGQLQVLARLDGVTNAAILRATTPVTSDDRRSALGVLAEQYLRQYSELGRLTQPIITLPQSIENFFVNVAKNIDGPKAQSGAFCSELVCLMMSSTFGIAGESPNRVAPSDFTRASTYLERVSGAVLRAPNPAALGSLASEQLTTEMKMWLSFPNALTQSMQSRVLQMFAYAPAFRADIDKSRSREEWQVEFERLRERYRKDWVDEIQSRLTLEIDPVWRWIQDSNVCYQTCPAVREKWAADQKVKDAKLASTSKSKTQFLSLREHRIIRAKIKCEDICSCTEVGLNYSSLATRYERMTAARFKAAGLDSASDA